MSDRTPKFERWDHGYVRPNKKGQGVYVIDKWIGGVHFHISTRRTSVTAAGREYERFERDPVNYHPAGAPQRELVTISDELVAGYRDFMLTEKRNSGAWIAAVLRYLAAWADELGNKDLRSISLARDVYPALDRWKTSRKHRVEALKGFCTWLRRKELLTRADDKTMDLAIPKTDPEKHRRRKVVSEEHLRATLPLLPEEVRDVAILQLGTSWHLAEVRRFAESGEIITTHVGALLAVLVTRHKSKDLTRTPIVHHEHLDAAKRIRARGKIPYTDLLYTSLRDACEKVRARQAKLGQPLMPHWRLGQLRHTVLTHAVQHGATPQQASEFAGHKSLATTRRYYIDLAVPTVTVPVFQLIDGGGKGDKKSS